MKKTGAALALILFVGSGWARAQSSIVSQIAGSKAATEKLYFSLKLGLSCGLLKGAGSESERLGGANIGLFATIRLSDRLSLAPEIDPVSRKGGTDIPFVSTGDPALDPYFAEPKSSALVLNYIDLPILLKYRLMSASERFRAESETGEALSFKRDVANGYRSRDYGFVLEASVVVTKPRRGEGLVFHVRYQGGVADILKDPAASSAVRTSVLQIFVSFPFIYGGK
jgi:hypothetical protein